MTKPPVRLFVFDGGILEAMDPQRFGLHPREVTTARMAVPAYLIVHPEGRLMWDTGCVPDSAWEPTATPRRHALDLPDGHHREVTLTAHLEDQLARAGYEPADVTYLGLSHYHYDHTGNANAFRDSTWLVPEVERVAMFGDKPPDLTRPDDYASLRDARTVLIGDGVFDVFGDGSVRLLRAPGHTPGHQVVVVRLPRTGTVVLSGDLYHYEEERTLDRVPNFEHDPAQTRSARSAIEDFVRFEYGDLWIQHDWRGYARRGGAPAQFD